MKRLIPDRDFHLDPAMERTGWLRPARPGEQQGHRQDYNRPVELLQTFRGTTTPDGKFNRSVFTFTTASVRLDIWSDTPLLFKPSHNGLVWSDEFYACFGQYQIRVRSFNVRSFHIGVPSNYIITGWFYA